MACNCKEVLVLKHEHARIKSSPNVTRPVDLSKLSASDYGLYATVWPEAFDLVKMCTCKKDKLSEAKKEAEEYIKKK